MLANVSYNNPKQVEKINALVGPSYSFKERIKMRGIGSPKMQIMSSSLTINNLLCLDHNTDSCSIELRPKGIIIRFRSLLETYGLIIPYYKLILFKGDIAQYSIYMDQYFIKVKSDTKAIQKFFKEVLDYKATYDPTAS
tara:strand:+ start:2283 stop:2699 length:417 start_codon:yes stop_codon:yes gene_type:complete